MTDLRNHLFAALEGLADDENPLDIERANTIANVAQTLINSAKVEVEHMRVAGRITATDFIPLEDDTPPLLTGRRQ